MLTTVFIRFCEDNGLVRPVWISGPGQRRQEALDARDAFFREHPEDTDREWLEQAIAHLRGLRATAALMDGHSALRLVSPSGQAATEVLEFWWQRGEDGAPVHDLSDPTLSTRFLGDLYQDLSKYAKATYALRQTPVFVEEFILDRTLEPALADRSLEGFRMIDPTCGSGHFLLGAFARLLQRWHRRAPGMEVQARVQTALDAIHGVDLNPFAVAIARFRLTVAALQACGLRALENAPAFRFHLAVGDSLLHGVEQLSLGMDGGHDRSDAALSGFTYSTEDLTALRSILEPGRYDVVVGNPPYITVKDRALNKAYRHRYSTCSGKYAMTVPFMERFFDLTKPGLGDQPAGWAGQITSNSFMKREFGVKLIESFLVTRDLRLIVDSSGAYIPGHGTPTVIVVGRNHAPILATTRVVLRINGEPAPPKDPTQGLVWRSIVDHVDQGGWSDSWVTVADIERGALAIHPWNLEGGGSIELVRQINGASNKTCKHYLGRAGFFGITGFDELALADVGSYRRWGVDPDFTKVHVAGDEVRDWSISPSEVIWFPYDGKELIEVVAAHASRFLWPHRTHLAARKTFSGLTYREDGRAWWSWHQLPDDSRLHPWAIVFSQLSTHAHFALGRWPWAFNSTATIMRLRKQATPDDHISLVAVLNSSTACFWLKQHSYPKGGDPIGNQGARVSAAAWHDRYQFTAAIVRDYPLPHVLPALRGKLLDGLSQDQANVEPRAIATASVPNRGALAEAGVKHDGLRTQMIAQQEELDWEVYWLYGLSKDNLTYEGSNLPGLALGERAFEIALARSVAAGNEETAWFERHGSTPITEIPSHWPGDYRELVQRRLDLIHSDPAIRLLEKPEYKRRWASDPWEKQEEAALRNWLLDRLEDRSFWLDRQGRPSPRSIAQLADEVARDADLLSVMALWEGRPDVPLTRSLTRLLEDEAVPYVAAHRYTDSGLAKHEAWEETWALQRREDAGEGVGTIPAPPKYTVADFRKTSYWQHRGKLDVPKERFILYPEGGRDTDPTPLLGWAGWDHAQQALALSQVLGAREAEGWPDERLVPLVAGLAELQPWVEQWHSELDPKYGVSLAAFCREQLTSRAAQVGMSHEELRRWRPQPVARRPRAAR